MVSESNSLNNISKKSRVPSKKQRISRNTQEVCINNTSYTNNTKKIICKICTYTTDRKSNYDRHLKSPKHIKMVNGEITKYVCKFDCCNYETTEYVNFYKHEKKHENKQSYLCECLACDIKLRDNEGARDHAKMKSHIENVKMKYPETLKERGYMKPWLDMNKSNVYMKKIGKGRIPKKEKKIEKPAEVIEEKVKKSKTITIKGKKKKKPDENEEDLSINKDTIIEIKDYIDYEKLTEKQMKKLIANAVKWMKENRIDPNDVYNENNTIMEKYIYIHEIMTDDPFTFFKDAGIEIKNII